MKIVFFGTPDFAVPSLRALAESAHEVSAVVAQPNRPAGRGMKLHTPPVAETARELGLTIEQPAKIRRPEFLEWLRERNAEIAVVVAYGKILPGELLAVPPHGFLNVHASLLPKYRGAAPIQRAIEHGETVTGVTIMRIDEELDHGPMLDRREIVIGADERAPDLAERLAAEGASLLVSVIDRLEKGEGEEIEQNHDLATQAAKIRKEEGRVDWNLPARAIYDRFRAFWPWPGLSVEVAGEMVKLIEIRPTDVEGDPGSIIDVDGESVVVGNGNGATRIIEVQRPGKRPVSAVEFLRSKGLSPGDRFGG